MRVGVIAEGPADVAVLVNVLRGALALDSEFVVYLRPELDSDETDLAARGPDTFSNWEHVKHECETRAKIDEFLESPIDETHLVVVHIDAAECELPNFDVKRPDRTGADYATVLRSRIHEAMARWLGGRALESIAFAIAIEETDAWVLAALGEGANTCAIVDPKKKLEQFVNKSFSDRARKQHWQKRSFAQYDDLSKPLRKRKALDQAGERNASLAAFVVELDAHTPTAEMGDDPPA